MNDLFHVDYAVLDTAPERMIAEAHIAQLRGLGVLVKVEATDRICTVHAESLAVNEDECYTRRHRWGHTSHTPCEMVDVVRVGDET